MVRSHILVCGGTGLYINALLYDMDFSAAPGDRAKREAILAEIGQGQPPRRQPRLQPFSVLFLQQHRSSVVQT